MAGAEGRAKGVETSCPESAEGVELGAWHSKESQHAGGVVGTGDGSGKRVWGLVLVLSSALMFSITSLMAKVLTTDAIPPLQAVLFRSVVQLLLTMLTMAYLQVPVCAALEWEDRKWLIARGVSGTFTLSAFYLSVQLLSLADASVCMFTAPVWTVFLARVVLKEPIRGVHLAAAAFSVVGVVFIARPEALFEFEPAGMNHSRVFAEGEAAGGVGRGVGIALGLCSALLQAFAFITMRKIRHLHYLLSVWSISVGGAVLGVLVVAASGEVVVPPSRRAWVLSLAIGGAGFWGQVFLNLGLRLERAGPASIVRNCDIVLAFVWQVLFLHDPLQWTSLVGGAIITACALGVALEKLNNSSLEPSSLPGSYAKVSAEEPADGFAEVEDTKGMGGKREKNLILEVQRQR